MWSANKKDQVRCDMRTCSSWKKNGLRIIENLICSNINGDKSDSANGTHNSYTWVGEYNGDV